jgi:glycosyltransferase involved in cell wall biosynthesis
MNSKDKISILMAVYNTDFKLVKRAIDSVLNQTFKNFELIIIDDGSNNDSENEILSYAIKHEKKITYLRHQNCSQSLSINKGIKLSNGKYITIIDADDEYKPDHLQKCLNQMQFYDLIASTTQTIVDKESHYYVPNRFDLSQNIHVDDCILFATLFGKRIVFEMYDFVDMYAADADFFEKASENFVVKKLNLRTYIYYRNMPNSISAKVKINNLVLN